MKKSSVFFEKKISSFFHHFLFLFITLPFHLCFSFPFLLYLWFSWSPSSWTHFSFTSLSIFLWTTISPSSCFFFLQKKNFSNIHFYMHGLPLDVLLELTHICSSVVPSRFYHLCFPFPSFVFSVHNLFFKTSLWNICKSKKTCLFISFLLGTFSCVFVFACLSFFRFSFFCFIFMCFLKHFSFLFSFVNVFLCWFPVSVLTKTVFLPCWSFEREMFLCVFSFFLLFSSQKTCKVISS